MADERTRLIDLATRLERLAPDAPDAEFEPMLAAFNAALRADCDRRQFVDLYQAMSPEDLVDSLLQRRARLPEVAAPITLAPEGLVAFLAARRDPGHYDHPAGYDEMQRDLDAIAPLTALPREVALLLLDAALPAEDAARFLLDYRPPREAEELWATARAWGRQLQGEVTPRGSVAIELLSQELSQVDVPELDLLVRLARQEDPRLRAYARKLGLLA